VGVTQKVPVIPISAQRKMNLDFVCQYLSEIPVPARDLESPPLMMVIRSFDVNKPNTEIEKIVGGVAGGTLIRGILRVGQTVEIRPGVIYLENGKKVTRPIRTKITSIFSETNQLKTAIPGGLIGIATNVDPSLTKSDRMVGHVIGIPGHMPEIYQELIIKYHVLSRVVGIENSEEEKSANSELKKEERVTVNIGSSTCLAVVKKVAKSGNCARISLDTPTCAEIGGKISISRRIGVGGHWRLIGFGKISDGFV